MPTFRDHNRKTPAANADILGEEADMKGPPPGSPPAPQRPAARPAASAPEGRRTEDTEARPGQDINAPGFVRDKDTEPS